MKTIEQSNLALVTGGEVGAIGSANGGGSNASYGNSTAASAPSVACTNAQNTASAAAVASGVACGTAMGPACVAGLIGLATATVNANNACEGEAGGGGGGGKVICTELCRNGVIDHDEWMADLAYSRKHFNEQIMRGYHAWGVPYVKLMRKSPLFAKLAEYPTQAFAQDIAYRMGVRAKPNYMGWALRELAFRPVCWSIGVFAKARDFQHLWTGKAAMA